MFGVYGDSYWLKHLTKAILKSVFEMNIGCDYSCGQFQSILITFVLLETHWPNTFHFMKLFPKQLRSGYWYDGQCLCRLFCIFIWIKC